MVEKDPKTDWKFGDLVWVAVHGFPKWPGQVMDPENAPLVVRKGEKEDRVLVSFFGDSSYGWFKEEVLFSFEESYTDFSKQTTTKQRLRKSFQEAVEEGKEILDRRRGVTPETMHDPVDFLDPETGSDEDGESKVYTLKQLFRNAGACPDNVGVEFGRKLGLDPMGVLSKLEGKEQETVAAALRQFWSCTQEMRGTMDTTPKRRKRGRKSRRASEELRKGVDVVDPEVAEAAERIQTQRVLREKRKMSRRDSPKRRTSQRLGRGSLVSPPHISEPVSQKSRRKKRQSSGQVVLEAIDYELLDVDRQVESKSLPSEKIGRKFTAKKLKRPRKHEGRFQFEFPTKFADIMVQCSEIDIVEATQLMAQDPLGAHKENSGETNSKDGVLLESSGTAIEEIWTPVHIAMFRYRLSVFKRFGGRPRGSLHKRITGELTPIQPFGNGKVPKIVSRKRSTDAFTSGVRSHKHRRSRADSKRSSYPQAIATHPVQGEKSVHIQFPEGREIPNTSQIQYFLLTLGPNMPSERIICNGLERKITVIFPYEEMAKEASLLFQELGPKYFSYPDGSVLSGISTYMPITLAVGIGGIQPSEATGQLPNTTGHDYGVPSGLPLIDVRPTLGPPIISVAHNTVPAPNIPYTESQVVQGVGQYVDNCIDQGLSQATWNLQQAHPAIPVPMTVPSSMQEKEMCCPGSEALPSSMPRSYFLPSDSLVYNMSQPSTNTVSSATLPVEQTEQDRLAIEVMIAEWAKGHPSSATSSKL